MLKAAFVQERLTKDEFDVRAGRALTARTSTELATLTADIPVGPAAARPPRKPARTCVIMIVIAASVLGVLLLTTPDNMGAFLAGLLSAATVVVASIATVALMLKSWHQRHFGRQHTAEAARSASDGAPVVLLVLGIAFLIVVVLMAIK